MNEYEEQKGKWVTVKGRRIFIKDGESPDEALNRTFGIKNPPQSKDGKYINGVFYTKEQLKKMSPAELKQLLEQKLGTSNNKSSDSSNKYSFSGDTKLSDTEKEWLEDAVDWANGKGTLSPMSMNTIANYYGIKFGKSATIFKGMNDKGDLETSSMNKTLINQLYLNFDKLKKAILDKESKQ